LTNLSLFLTLLRLDVIAPLAPTLFHQSHALDAHRSLYRFSHIIDGEGGYTDRSQRFHLYACTAMAVDGSFDFNPTGRFVKDKFDVYVCQGNGVAEWDQLGGTLGRHHAGKPSGIEYVAFGQVPLSDEG
jgi:hypothetical protein